MQSLDLNGAWQIRWSDGVRGRVEYANRDVTDESRYIDATVPGEVHLDLLRAGLISDPYRGAGALAARWVEECLWAYRKEFDAPAETLDGRVRSWLVFEGLDLVATVFLNGVEIGNLEKLAVAFKVDTPSAADFSLRGIPESRTTSSVATRKLPDTWGLESKTN